MNSPHERLTMVEIFARRVPIECPEAIAIVRGAAECVVERFGSSDFVPNLDQIYLQSDGLIDVADATESSEPVRRMGQLAQALLAESDTPVQLRLVISQAMAPTPGYASVRQFGDALGYFERPNRRKTLQALYGRAVSTPVVGESDPAPILDRLAPLPAAPPSPVSQFRRATPPSKRRVALLVAGAGLVALGIAGAARYIQSRGLQTQWSSAADRGSRAAGRAVLAGVSAVTDRVGLGRLVAADAVSQPLAAAPLYPTIVSAPRRRPVPLKAEPFLAFDLEPGEKLVPPAAEHGATLPTAGSPEERPGDTGGSTDATTYGAGSEGVTPPVAVRPQLPRELPSTVRSAKLAQIELIVAKDGSVASVKLLDGPHDVSDAMFLSAAKAWRFQPALKNGAPVQYRKTIWIVSR